MTEGDGWPLRLKQTYHLCLGAVKERAELKRKDSRIHSGPFRRLTPSDIKEGHVGWLRGRELRDKVVTELTALEEKTQGVKPKKKKKQSESPEKETEEEEEPDDEEEASDSSGDSAEVQKRLEKLRQELKEAEERASAKKRKGKKKPSRSRGREKSRSQPRGKTRKRSPSPGGGKDKDKARYSKEKDKDREPKARKKESRKEKDKKKEEKEPKKRREEKDESEEEILPGSSGDELFQSAKPKAKDAEKSGKADRGPFGGGPAIGNTRKVRKRARPIPSGFRGVPARTTSESGQQKLTPYSRRFPGRLPSRLLIKMREGAARDLVGANNEDTLTPPLASHYLITVLIPALGNKASLRTQRELRTLAKGLDHLARGELGQAADLLCQRIKALDRATQEGSWQSAQFLELLPPDGVTLLERDEEMFLRNEFILDQKANRYGDRNWSNQNRSPKGDGKNDRQQKGKGDGKDPRRLRWRRSMASPPADRACRKLWRTWWRRSWMWEA